MKRIYVAGKYSADNVMDVLGNIRSGIAMSRELLLLWCAPYCPWLDFLYVITADLMDFDKMDKTIFQRASMEWVGCCDAMIVISGADTSRGVRAEIERARELNIPVYYEISDMKNAIQDHEA